MTRPVDAAPSLELIEEYAFRLREALPDPWRRLSADVVIRVEDWPDDEMLEDLELDSPYALTGLYDGIPLTERSVSDVPQQPDVVWLFRRPMLDEWCDRGDVGLGEYIAHVLIHELAHHFGWSDDDIAAIDRWWE